MIGFVGVVIVGGESERYMSLVGCKRWDYSLRQRLLNILRQRISIVWEVAVNNWIFTFYVGRLIPRRVHFRSIWTRGCHFPFALFILHSYYLLELVFLLLICLLVWIQRKRESVQNNFEHSLCPYFLFQILILLLYFIKAYSVVELYYSWFFFLWYTVTSMEWHVDENVFC